MRVSGVVLGRSLPGNIAQQQSRDVESEHVKEKKSDSRRTVSEA